VRFASVALFQRGIFFSYTRTGPALRVIGTTLSIGMAGTVHPQLAIGTTLVAASGGTGKAASPGYRKTVCDN
jgi:hypothetical protein